jgi:hypothetical protein
MATVVPGTVNVSEVAPGTSLKVVPLLVETCHCTVGAGVPDACDVNVAVAPAVTVWSVGCVVTTGALVATVTVSVAGFDLAVPAELVNTVRYLLPL